jgi:hypothetical protein
MVSRHTSTVQDLERTPSGVLVGIAAEGPIGRSTST